MRRRSMLAGVATTVGGMIAAGTGTAGAAGAPGLRDHRLVSLSHVNDPDRTNVYPGDPAFKLTTITTVPEDGFYLQYVEQGEHTGTHWGAPAHFNSDEPAADELDVEDLFLPAVKIDVRDKARRDADYEVTVDDLQRWERKHGRIPNEAAVILWTGWEDRWGTPAFYNYDTQGRMHQPGFSLAAVQWLVRTGRLGRRGALGTDTFSPESALDAEYRVSKLLYREHRISLEILANLAKLPETGAHVLVGGTINRRGSGSPATVFAFVPRR
ncbi:cyclase family protein [Saccharothrix violaceirubra]|uniref:Kynurenine formamidase n=1 Tax=Saccharothrix violaceirubra TaxID=413306 RepID=A0A7W7WVD0_9PSEU|nr:cyclase family protein [Saccharothrix violaceirubra]MBB4964802.1 kynurenine formamidase [Saccharothrix violaceirubra]